MTKRLKPDIRNPLPHGNASQVAGYDRKQWPDVPEYAALGTVIFAGALSPGLARISATLGALVFFAFAFGRMVSIALDGWRKQPSSELFKLSQNKGTPQHLRENWGYPP